MTIPRLLVVEDDVEMRTMMTQFLRQNGFYVMEAASEHDVQDRLKAGRVDLILLDVMLGPENGIEICERIRGGRNVPVIMVTALSADHQRMDGYAAGADDYIAKPFNPELMLARVRAVLKRTHRSSSLSYRRRLAIYHFAGWKYDGRKDEVTAPKGFQVSLSQRETALLQVLLANPFIPLTREEIMSAFDVTQLGGATPDASGRAIDVLVGRLRAKIETNPKEPELLKTERGVGYVFAADVTESDS